MRAVPEQDASFDRFGILAGSVRASLCSVHAGDLPNGSPRQPGHGYSRPVGSHLFRSARGTETL